MWVNEVGAINFFGQGFAPDLQRQSRVMAYLLSTYAQVSPRHRADLRLPLARRTRRRPVRLGPPGRRRAYPGPPTTCSSRPSAAHPPEPGGVTRPAVSTLAPMSRRTIILAALAAALLGGGVAFALTRRWRRRAAPGPTRTQARRRPTRRRRPSRAAPEKRASRASGPAQARAGDVRLTGFAAAGRWSAWPTTGPRRCATRASRPPASSTSASTCPTTTSPSAAAPRPVQDAYFANARQAGVAPGELLPLQPRDPDPAQRGPVPLGTCACSAPATRGCSHFSTWNEPNFRSQPTSRDPARTAAFYRILRDECSGGRCTVVTCDFRPDGTAQSARWLETFKRGDRARAATSGAWRPTWT